MMTDNTKPVIRPVEPGDDAPLARIIRDCFDEFHLPRVHTVYDDPDTDRQYEIFRGRTDAGLFVAVVDGRVVGSCGVYPTQGLPEGWCEIVKYYLDSHYRGLGIGRDLMLRALDAARRLGYTTAYLETFHELATAVDYYRRLGFEPLKQQIGFSGHTATDIWMTVRL
jgi:putative acetyltransferase